MFSRLETFVLLFLQNNQRFHDQWIHSKDDGVMPVNRLIAFFNAWIVLAHSYLQNIHAELIFHFIRFMCVCVCARDGYRLYSLTPKMNSTYTRHLVAHFIYIVV